MIGAPEDAVFAGGLERAWIDELVPEDASVTKLYLETDCPSSASTRHALFLTEFFNSTVDRAAYIGDSVPDGLPIDRVEVEDGGASCFRRAAARGGLRLHAAGDRARRASASARGPRPVSSSGGRTARCGRVGARTTADVRTATARPDAARGGDSRSG